MSTSRLLILALVCAVAVSAAVQPASAADIEPGAVTTTDGQPAPVVPVPPQTVVAPTDFIVVLDDDATAADVARLARSARDAGGSVSRTFDRVLPAAAVSAGPEALSRIRRLPGVAYVHPNAVVTPDSPSTRTEPGWALDRIDQAALPLDDGYTYDGDGRGVRAYILDSGVSGTHEEFGGRVEPGYSVVPGEPVADEDCYGHGTPVAGAVGGARYGVASGVTIVPVKIVEACVGNSTTEYVLAALEWVAENGVRPAVANLSYGELDYPIYRDAMNAVVDSGIPLVLSAGNEDEERCATPTGSEAVLVVGASTDEDERASFSNYGPCVDLFAPGFLMPLATSGVDDDLITHRSGTSFAAPMVAGSVALLLQDDPGATPAEVTERLMAAVTPDVIGDVPSGTSDLLRSPVAGPITSGYLPVGPERIAGPLSLGPGESTVVALPADLPPDLTAAAVNVTVAGADAATYVSVCPAEEPADRCGRISSVNAEPGRDVATMAFPVVGPSGALRVRNNAGQAAVYLDLVGVYSSTAAAGLDFVPLAAPERDDEEPVVSGTADEPGSTVVTLEDAPPGAVSAAVRVTVSGVTANTFVTACPTAVPAEECAESSTLNADGRDTSNLTVVALDEDDRFRLLNNRGQVNALVDVLGFYVPAGGGSRYLGTPQQRVQERAQIAGGDTLGVPLLGRAPTDVTAVTATLTTAGTTAVGYASMCPGGSPTDLCAASSTVNVYPGSDIAGATVVATGGSGDVTTYLATGSGLLFTDVQGWFVDVR